MATVMEVPSNHSEPVSTSPRPVAVSGALENLIVTYQELNSWIVDELTSEPSPLEFMRYVARNRPFVVREGAAHWPATRAWNGDYLRAAMGPSSVNVAITPAGNADSVAINPQDGRTYFVKPLEELEPFGAFLSYVQEQEQTAGERAGENGESSTKWPYCGKRSRSACPGKVLTARLASENDNLRDEYATLYQDVEADIPWARIALEGEPDAINLWIGNSRSVTALHRDNYENIYCQIVGSKHFVLLPPIAMPSVNELPLQAATYARNVDQGAPRELIIQPDDDAEVVPVAVWDPDRPSEHSTPFSKLTKPMRVDLHPGDMLYLPSLWYHKVSQVCGEEGFCCAVNYWYDMDFSGSAYSTSAFVREIALTRAHASSS